MGRGLFNLRNTAGYIALNIVLKLLLIPYYTVSRPLAKVERKITEKGLAVILSNTVLLRN